MFFDDIFGHESQIESLKTRLREGTLAHALLLTGPPGVGKRRLAEALAAAVLCERGPKAPCGECPACRKSAALSHPDTLIVEPDEKSGTIRLESVRRIRNKIAFKPFEAGAIAVILDGAGAMNPEAQNALLKILEEPPGPVVFVLIEADPALLLPTVRSRCQSLVFEPLRPADQARVLSAHCGMEPSEAEGLARLSGGSMEKALYLRESDYVQVIEAMFAILQAARSGELAPLGEWTPDRKTESACVDVLAQMVRDMLLIKTGCQEGRLFFAGRREALGGIAGRFSAHEILDLLEALGRSRERLRASANAKLVFSELLTDIGIQVASA